MEALRIQRDLHPSRRLLTKGITVRVSFINWTYSMTATMWPRSMLTKWPHYKYIICRNNTNFRFRIGRFWCGGFSSHIVKDWRASMPLRTKEILILWYAFWQSEKQSVCHSKSRKYLDQCSQDNLLSVHYLYHII